jgi:hypothetical protein
MTLPEKGRGENGYKRENGLPMRATGITVLLALLGCHGAPSVSPATVTGTPPAPASSTGDSSDDMGITEARESLQTESSLEALSRAWAEDGDLTLSGNRPADDLVRCPLARSDLRTESRAQVPPAFVRFEGIATHACDAVLWVFLGCTAAGAEGKRCDSWAERLLLEPIGTGVARVLGNVEPEMGGNAGGLFVPFAFTRDDRWILLRASMFSPGAGGAAVDYGLGIIPVFVARSPQDEKAPLTVEPLPARDPTFYAQMGCAIGLANSDKTPSYTQPGYPSDNGGALVAVDLATMKQHTLLEERDTTYSVDRLDEKAGALDIEVTRHTFGKNCPREEGALGCSTSIRSKRRLPLPACLRLATKR